jgi:hypothetical protein
MIVHSSWRGLPLQELLAFDAGGDLLLHGFPAVPRLPGGDQGAGVVLGLQQPRDIQLACRDGRGAGLAAPLGPRPLDLRRPAHRALAQPAPSSRK